VTAPAEGGGDAAVATVEPVDNSTGTTVDRGVPREPGPVVVDNQGSDEHDEPVGRRDAERTDRAGDKADDEAGDKPAKAGPWKVEDLPTGAQKLIQDLRKEAGDHRVSAKTLEAKVAEADKKLEGFLSNMAKVLGLAPDADPDTPPEPPDPGKLTAQLKAAQKEHREAIVRLAVFEAASEHHANPRALTDSVRFLNSVNKLDPHADDFGDQISAAVAEAVADNPLFRVARPAPAPTAAPSGGQFAGGPGRTQNPESLSIDDYREALKKRRPA
jgi:hypothetical protein